MAIKRNNIKVILTKDITINNNNSSFTLKEGTICTLLSTKDRCLAHLLIESVAFDGTLFKIKFHTKENNYIYYND